MDKDEALNSLLNRTGEIVLNTILMGIRMDHMEEDIKGMRTNMAMLVNQIPIRDDDVKDTADKTLDVEKSIVQIEQRLGNLERIIKEELGPDLDELSSNYRTIKWKVEEATWNKIKFEYLKDKMTELENRVNALDEKVEA